MKQFVVEIEAYFKARPGGMIYRKGIRAGTPRVAVDHALKKSRSFGLSYNGGLDRQLAKGEVLEVRVLNWNDVPEPQRPAFESSL